MNKKTAPTKTETFLYIASLLVMIAYIWGGVYSTFKGVDFMFSTSSGIEGFLVYNILLGMLVFPLILVAAAFFYIIVYLDQRK